MLPFRNVLCTICKLQDPISRSPDCLTALIFSFNLLNTDLLVLGPSIPIAISLDSGRFALLIASIIFATKMSAVAYEIKKVSK